MHEAKTQLSKLVERAEAGEDVVICRNGQPVARLVPYVAPVAPRKPGSLKGKVWLADDWEETPEWLIELFEGGE